MNNLLLDALKYADRGWYVFPARYKDGKEYTDKDGKQVIPRAKSPYMSSGLKIATIDSAEIKEMWKMYPTSCVAVNCGMSGLFVIDLDRKDENKTIAVNFRGLENFMKLGISTEGALTAITPSGGLHYYFSGTGKTSSKKKTQIDTRGMGGYVVAPPSSILSDGKWLSYLAHGNWSKTPVQIPPSAFEKLGLTRKKCQNDINFEDTDFSSDKTFQRVRKEMINLPVSAAYEYQDWLEIGIFLKNFGDVGFKMWSWWTEKYFSEKPNSKRVGTLEKKWNKFYANGEIKMGTFIYHVKNAKK